MKKIILIIIFLLSAFLANGYIIRYEIPIYDVDQVIDYENFTENFTIADSYYFKGNGIFDQVDMSYALLTNPPTECPSGSYMTYTNLSSSVCVAAVRTTGDTISGSLNITENLNVTGNVTASYFKGDGSLLAGITPDSLGNHTASQSLNMRNQNITNVSAIFVKDIYGLDDDPETADNSFDINDNVYIRASNFIWDDSATANTFVIRGPNKPQIFFERVLGQTGLHIGYTIGREYSFLGVRDVEAGFKLIIANSDYTGVPSDFDHATQSNPTLYIQSATDPDDDNTQWMSLTHNTTNPLIDSGKGNLTFISDVTFGTTAYGDGTNLDGIVTNPLNEDFNISTYSLHGEQEKVKLYFENGILVVEG